MMRIVTCIGVLVAVAGRASGQTGASTSDVSLVCYTTSVSASGAPVGTECALPFYLSNGTNEELHYSAVTYGEHTQVGCPVHVNYDTRVVESSDDMAYASCHYQKCWTKNTSSTRVAPGTPCVFPFNENRFRRRSCVIDSVWGEGPWCAIAVDDNGDYGYKQWGLCECENTDNPHGGGSGGSGGGGETGDNSLGHSGAEGSAVATGIGASVAGLLVMSVLFVAYRRGSFNYLRSDALRDLGVPKNFSYSPLRRDHRSAEKQGLIVASATAPQLDGYGAAGGAAAMSPAFDRHAVGPVGTGSGSGTTDPALDLTFDSAMKKVNAAAETAGELDDSMIDADTTMEILPILQDTPPRPPKAVSRPQHREFQHSILSTKPAPKSPKKLKEEHDQRRAESDGEIGTAGGSPSRPIRRADYGTVLGYDFRGALDSELSPNTSQTPSASSRVPPKTPKTPGMNSSFASTIMAATPGEMNSSIDDIDWAAMEAAAAKLRTCRIVKGDGEKIGMRLLNYLGPNFAGVKVVGIHPGSPAATSGVIEGDSIVEIANTPVINLYHQEVIELLGTVGDSFDLIVCRD